MGAVVPLVLTVTDSDGFVFPATAYKFMNLTFQVNAPAFDVDVQNHSALTGKGVHAGATTVRAIVQNCVHMGLKAVPAAYATSSWVAGGMRCWRVVSPPVDVVVFVPLAVLPGRVSLLPDARCVRFKCACTLPRLAPWPPFLSPFCGVHWAPTSVLYSSPVSEASPPLPLLSMGYGVCVPVNGGCRLMLRVTDGPRAFTMYRFRSSNSSVATVDRSGMVFGHRIGTTAITVEVLRICCVALGKCVLVTASCALSCACPVGVRSRVPSIVSCAYCGCLFGCGQAMGVDLVTGAEVALDRATMAVLVDLPVAVHISTPTSCVPLGRGLLHRALPRPTGCPHPLCAPAFPCFLGRVAPIPFCAMPA